MTKQLKIEELNFKSLVGKRYKSWKQFCEENNINYSDSSAYKKSQKQKLEKYCKIKWINTKEFIIKEMYETPKPTKTKKGRQGEFATPLEKLLRYLPQDTYMSMNKILKELFLITDDYTVYKFNKQKCVQDIMYELDKPMFGIKEYDDYTLGKIVDTFYMQSSFIGENIKSKLNTLAKNNIINLDIKTRIKHGTNYRYATKEEEKTINAIESIVIDMLDCKNKSEVLMKNKYQDFAALVSQMLELDNIKLDMYYPAYSFTFVEEKKGRKHTDDAIFKLKMELRDKYIGKVFSNLNGCDKQIEYIEKISHGDLDKETIKLYLNKLCDFLIVGKPYKKHKSNIDYEVEDKINGIPF